MSIVLKGSTDSKVVKSIQSVRVVKPDITRQIVKNALSRLISKANILQKTVNSKIRAKDLDTSRFIYHETPTPATDGAQTVFTVANAYVSGLLEVFLDGLLQIKDNDYTETTSTTFTMTTAPASDEKIEVNYIKQ